MKIKFDFITNSSSSSFVCFGVDINKINIPIERYKNIAKEWYSEEELNKMDDDEIKSEVIYETGLDELIINNLIDYGGPEREYYFIGITPEKLFKKFPEEKIKDIKKIVANELNKEFNTNFTEKDICYYEEGWYAG